MTNGFVLKCTSTSRRIQRKCLQNTSCYAVAGLSSTLAEKRTVTEGETTKVIESEENESWVARSFEAEDESGVMLDNQKAPKHKESPMSQFESRPFPLGMIVDMDEIKRALILAAINPRIGGLVISGRRGTGKSVLARAVHRLLPKYIERVKGNPYNIDPTGKDGIDSFLQHEMISSGLSFEEMEMELVPTPFVQIPLNVMEDSLLGTVDLEKSVQTGRSEFSPGLLAKAHRGILYVDEINLLDEEAANLLLNVIADGYVIVEREGLSVQYPCKPLLIAT